jgi:hypothetical protein
MSFRAKINRPAMTMMGGLVGGRRVSPNVAGHIDVDGPHDAKFARACRGQQLQVDKCFDLPGNEWPDRVNEFIRNRLDRIGLSGRRASTLQARNRPQSLIDGRR